MMTISPTQAKKIEIKLITDESRRHITFLQGGSWYHEEGHINCFIYATSRHHASAPIPVFFVSLNPY